MADNFDDISTAREESSFVIDTDKEKEYKAQTKEESLGGYHPSYVETNEEEVSPLRKHYKVVIGLTVIMLWYVILNFLQSREIISPGLGFFLCFPPLIVGLIAFAVIKNNRLR